MTLEAGVECAACGGSGEVACEFCDGSGECRECNRAHEHACPDCDGTGLEICTDCNGVGTVDSPSRSETGPAFDAASHTKTLPHAGTWITPEEDRRISADGP